MNISESSLTESLFIYPEGIVDDFSVESVIVQVGLAALATYSIARCYLKPFKATLTDEESFAKNNFFKVVFPGKSDIYLNPDRPDILIKFPSENSKWDPTERARKQGQYKQMCARDGYHHLIVPTVSQEKNYLIEEKLPLTHPTHRGQIALYCANKDLFTDAIKDLTHLLCTQKKISLIWGECHFRAFGGSRSTKIRQHPSIHPKWQREDGSY